MIATNHVVTGMLVATAVHNPAVAMPVAFLSHFALDALPHFTKPDEPFNSVFFKVVLASDVLAAATCLVVVLLVGPAHMWLILACGVLAASPDLMWIPAFIAANTNKKPPARGPIRRFHGWIQWYQKPPGAIVEALWLVAIILLLNDRLPIVG